MRLSDMRRVLADRDIRLTRSLGQSFLHDGNQLRRIIATADLGASDRVLEIGPGLGPLTELLLERAGSVLAIEKDPRLAAYLRERFADCPRLTLVEADAVKYLRAEPRDWRGWKLVANLPYSVASTILIDMALNVNGPARQVVTLQFEVARRLVAHAGEPDYGVLTLLVQVAYQPGAWFRIPASCFHPPPKVDSAGVDLCRRAAPLLSPAATDLFSALVKRAFSQRRKMMLKLLQTQWPQARWEQAFARLDLSAQARAETVTLEQFAELTRWLCP